MAVEVELFAQLAGKYFHKANIEIETERTVINIIEELNLNPEEIGLVTIDGVQSGMEDLVPRSCRLCFFPPMSGG